MDTNTGEISGHQSQSQQLGNSPTCSEEEMGHWTPTGVEPRAYDDECNVHVGCVDLSASTKTTSETRLITRAVSNKVLGL